MTHTAPFAPFPLAMTLALSIAAVPLSAAENLVSNPGFEDGMDGWDFSIRGDWSKKVDQGRLAQTSADARSGSLALCVDTRLLNPAGRITDDFRIPKNTKYEITLTQKVSPVEPDAWYLTTFHVKAPAVAVDEGLEYLADIEPWPLQTFGADKNVRPLWKMIHAWERRLFLPQAPLTDGRYHRHVLLKQTYATTDTLEIGLRIRAPWTGRILIDDVRLEKVDPGRDLTPTQKFLAMRATTPFTSVRPLDRQTTLAAGGKPTSAILIPPSESYAPLGAKIQAAIAKLTGATPPVVTQLDDVPSHAAIVAVGSMMKNELVARLHFNRYVRVDALSPGPGGYVVWTVAEPYGLQKHQNVIVVAGSDAAGEAAAVDDFCNTLSAQDGTITLPFLHKVFPARTIEPDEREVPRSRWGFNWDRERFAGFANWYLPRWLATGDLEVARLARREILEVADAYLEDPYFQVAWDAYEVGWAWDTFEEVSVFSDDDRLKITNLLLGYLHMRPQAGTSGWSALVPRRVAGEPTWNHQAKGLSGAYAMARYFHRYYADRDARYANYLAAAHNTFGQQARYSKPQENSANYWLITMKFALSYYLGEWDMTFFENDAMRRYAEYFAAVCDNRGGLSGFGDAYYCYSGWRAADGFDPWQVPLAFWRYKDGRFLWWLTHLKPDYENPYHQDVPPEPWDELLGVRKVPLERGLYVAESARPFWSAEGDGAMTAGRVPFEKTFDKISFRNNWEPDGQYLLLEGLGRGIHSGKATNQICKLSILGEDLLIGSTYLKNNPRTNCSVIVVKDAQIDDPEVKGPGQFPFQWWAPLGRKIRGYASLDALADLPHAGFTRTSIPDHLGGTDWQRNLFWHKGNWFATIDQIVPQAAGTYHVEANYSTCPQPRGGSHPRLTKRTWKITEPNRQFEVTYQTPGQTKHYILTDGTAELVIDPFVYQPQSMTKVIVRQILTDRTLSAGQPVSLFTFFYGDRENSRKDYRLHRLSPTEALLLESTKPIAYFGTTQSPKTKAILPIQATMFLLTPNTLSLVNATSAAQWRSPNQPQSTEIPLPSATQLLLRLQALIQHAEP